jgi:hypothetical protein
MSAAMYDEAVVDFARGDLDWERDDIRVALFTDDYQPSQSSDATYADLRRFEVGNTGSYRAGGSGLSGRLVERSELGGQIRLMGEGVSWTGVTGQFRYAVVYRAGSDDRLVSYTDLGRQEATNARVTLEYDRDGGVAEFTVASVLSQTKE